MSEKLDLDAIEARVNEATPGPWEAYGRDVDNLDGWFLGWEVEGPPGAVRGQFEKGADAQFIAQARQDIPALLQCVREMRTVVHYCKSGLSDLSDDSVKSLAHDMYDRWFGEDGDDDRNK